MTSDISRTSNDQNDQSLAPLFLRLALRVAARCELLQSNGWAVFFPNRAAALPSTCGKRGCEGSYYPSSSLFWAIIYLTRPPVFDTFSLLENEDEPRTDEPSRSNCLLLES